MLVLTLQFSALLRHSFVRDDFRFEIIKPLLKNKHVTKHSQTCREVSHSSMLFRSSLNQYFFRCMVISCAVILYSLGLSRAYEPPLRTGGFPLIQLLILGSAVSSPGGSGANLRKLCDYKWFSQQFLWIFISCNL